MLISFFKIVKINFFISRFWRIFALFNHFQNRQSMTAEIKGDNLIITVPINKQGEPSSSGKSNNHYVSAKDPVPANVTINGKKATIALNVYTSVK